MGKRKLFNDPIYGLISFPDELIYDIIDHPFFQRLRRISQMGLSSLIYSGAVHNRFHHALGATHLMTRALDTLRKKGVDITDEEYTGACLAILLHDIGHGPFSHTMENTLLKIHHEEISLGYMEYLNKEFGGKLDTCIDIFKGTYEKPFLHQLVSGQLDMDRMDYLTRDTYYTGVAEGVIGYDRIIAMLHVHDNKLVVEEKGIHSIEKFLMARLIMYWQVYLHKTGLAAEEMLISFYKRIKVLHEEGVDLPIGSNVKYFLDHMVSASDLQKNEFEALKKFALLDDIDIWYDLKNLRNSDDSVLRYLSNSILNRKLFKVIIQDDPFECDFVNEIRHKIVNHLNVEDSLIDYLVITGRAQNQAYTTSKDEIIILTKEGVPKPISLLAKNLIGTDMNARHFLCHAAV